MNRAFLFPGQGSQYISMGHDLYRDFSVAKDVFDEVDDVLGYKLSNIIFYGDISELTRTSNAQPAIMATSIAIYRVMQKYCDEDISPSFVCGHSLGEYSALCVAGSMSLSSATKLLKIRGQSMELASNINQDSGMVACINVEFDMLQELLHDAQKLGVCQIANDNGAKQVVLSGETVALDYISEVLAKLGKKTVKLKVSGAFHSSIMLNAESAMREALSQHDITKPNIPVIPNILAVAVEDPDVIKQSLIDQICGTVRWRETMDFLKNHDVQHVIEMGPGNILSTLAKKHMQIIMVQDAKDLYYKASR